MSLGADDLASRGVKDLYNSFRWSLGTGSITRGGRGTMHRKQALGSHTILSIGLIQIALPVCWQTEWQDFTHSNK